MVETIVVNPEGEAGERNKLILNIVNRDAEKYHTRRVWYLENRRLTVLIPFENRRR